VVEGGEGRKGQSPQKKLGIRRMDAWAPGWCGSLTRRLVCRHKEERIKGMTSQELGRLRKTEGVRKTEGKSSNCGEDQKPLSGQKAELDALPD